tara:strand:- start:850 stop:1680 length:831 start_codon:yes stop_codon:yes gene_type:complete
MQNTGLKWFDFCTFQIAMKYAFYIFLINVSMVFSQKSLETTFIDSQELVADNLISVDNFKTIYFTKNNVFFKKNNKNSITYNNLQLGNLETVNAFNPLKINLFYKDFNTIIILDNRLAEIFKIDFNALPDYKNVSHISTGYDNTIWVFNQDLQQLELYDYKTNKVRVQTIPVQSQVLDLKSNYNMCWLLTKNNLYVYNYFGSLLKKIPNMGFTALETANEDIVLRKENTLLYLKKNTIDPIPILLPNLLINQFFVTNQTLYIYNDETLQEFQIKTN